MSDNNAYYSDYEIAEFQKSVPCLRLIAGWSADDLAKRLDISRSKMYHIEHSKKRMTAIEYLAIRKLFDEESVFEGNYRLEWSIEYLLNEDVSDEDKNVFRKNVLYVAKHSSHRKGAIEVGTKLRRMRLEDLTGKGV